MYAQHLAFAAPIHFIGVKKDAELRGSDSIMQAAMCYASSKYSGRAVLGSRYAPTGVVAIPMSAVKRCMSLVTPVLYTP